MSNVDFSKMSERELNAWGCAGRLIGFGIMLIAIFIISLGIWLIWLPN